MEKNDFEKRRKGVETLFDVIFWFQLIGLIIAIVLKILYKTGTINTDLYSYKVLAINLGFIIFLFLATRLAKKGHIAAGIIGLIIGIGELISGGLTGTILGILLIIDSILFLVNYNKK